jgi:hypothetical protein
VYIPIHALYAFSGFGDAGLGRLEIEGRLLVFVEA